MREPKLKVCMDVMVVLGDTVESGPTKERVFIILSLQGTLTWVLVLRIKTSAAATC